MDTYSPPPFLPARLIRGGHLQTIAALRSAPLEFRPDNHELVRLPDGDAIVLHRNDPVDGTAAEAGSTSARVLVLFHGLGGCHRSPYMIRLSTRFVSLGWTVYRADLRGCGAARQFASGISHAGRSDDIRAALDFVAGRHPDASIAAAGVSLGGNQLLRLVGRIGAGLDPTPGWFGRLSRIGVVAPPIDLVRCSENMERLSRRPYNYFFIRALLNSVPAGIERQESFQRFIQSGRPKTLYQLDDRLTAPLSGFEGAADYYQSCGAATVCSFNPVPTLVLASRDDPIVPVGCFDRNDWPKTTRLIMTNTGGHAGFVGREKQYWMDECLITWTNQL